jgi:hypothetical protein
MMIKHTVDEEAMIAAALAADPATSADPAM